MEVLGSSNDTEKLAQIFYCEHCDYKTSRKYNYTVHLSSSRHQKNADLEVAGSSIQQNSAKACIAQYLCETCNKSFQTSGGLWKHKQKCMTEHASYLEQKTKNITDKDELITFLIKENSEFKNMLLEQQTMMMKVIENGTHNTTNNNTTHTNSHNKAFNLNFFLNETCKNAMNLTDFVDSIKLQISDLERVGELGYVQGISDIITSNLKAMDITMRPVHCTDKKRETMYIKDNDEWKKEEDNKPYLKKVIKKIEDKNMRMIPLYRAKYPDYNDTSSKRVDKYDKIILESMGGIYDEDNKLDKIIRNISSVTTINK